MALPLARIALAFSLAVGPSLFAQGANSASAAGAQSSGTMPNDPGTLLNMAAKVNGLSGPNLHPWHLKASYQTFDLKGKPQDSGTYEEFWISDKKYRSSYTSAGFMQTDIAADGHLYRSGDQDWPGLLEATVREDLTEPIPELSFQDFKLDEEKRSVGSVKLLCVTLTSAQRYALSDLYCFSQDQPVLRSTSAHGADQTIFNGIVIFQGRGIAKDIRMEHRGNPRLFVHVETIESISQVNEALFVPPSDAMAIPTDETKLPKEAANAFRVLTVQPAYPVLARANYVQGTVVVQATIGKDGSVIAATAVSGPRELRQSAVDGVRQWRFRPFLILGEPVEVETQWDVVYTLSG